MKITDKNYNLVLTILIAILLIGCVLAAWFGLLLLNRPRQPGLVFQTPTNDLSGSPTSPFELGTLATGTPEPAQPSPTTNQLAETATVQATETGMPIPTGLPAAGGLPGKIFYPHRFNNLNAIYWVDLENNAGPAALMEPVSDLALVAPVVSPDGTKVTFHYPREDMYVLTIGDNNPVRLAKCGAPSWSPDSSQVICRSSEEATFIIVDVQTGGLVRSIPINAGALFPTWSPTGNELVYNLRDSQGNSSIWRLSLSGDSSPVLLAGEAGGENYAPSWSPDGQWIAFQSNMDGELSDIYIMDRNGGNLRRVVNTPPEYWSRAPSWSPDGQWLAYVSDQAGSIGSDYGEIFAVHLATGEVRQVTQTGGRVYDWRVSWGK